jgi:hypothetical protein
VSVYSFSIPYRTPAALCDGVALGRCTAANPTSVPCRVVPTLVSYPKDMYVRRYAELVSELAYEY